MEKDTSTTTVAAGTPTPTTKEVASKPKASNVDKKAAKALAQAATLVGGKDKAKGKETPKGKGKDATKPAPKAKAADTKSHPFTFVVKAGNETETYHGSQIAVKAFARLHAQGKKPVIECGTKEGAEVFSRWTTNHRDIEVKQYLEANKISATAGLNAILQAVQIGGKKVELKITAPAAKK